MWNFFCGLRFGWSARLNKGLFYGQTYQA